MVHFATGKGSVEVVVLAFRRQIGDAAVFEELVGGHVFELGVLLAVEVAGGVDADECSGFRGAQGLSDRIGIGDVAFHDGTEL